MQVQHWDPAALPAGEGEVRLERVEDWWELVLDNPGARNALSPGMMAALGAAATRLQAEPEGAVLLVRGAGERAFCAGGDLRSVRANLLVPGTAEGMQRWMSQALDTLAALPRVILASVEGAALGGGAELLTACDEVFASRLAKVGFVHVTLGVSPGWGGARRLVRRVGSRRALRLLLCGPEADVVQARELGLVDHLCEPGQALAQARARARVLSALPPQAVRGAVRIARSEGDPAVERAVFASLWGAPDHQRALARSRKGHTPSGRG